MSGHDDLDRMLDRWFESQAAPPGPPDVLRRAIEHTRTRRPRPLWLAPVGSHRLRSRQAARPGMRRGWSLALVLLLALIALGAGAIQLGALEARPSPSPPPTARPGELAYGL